MNESQFGRKVEDKFQTALVFKTGLGSLVLLFHKAGGGGGGGGSVHVKVGLGPGVPRLVQVTSGGFSWWL